MDDCLYLTLSVPDVGMQEQAEHSATYLMHAEHAKLAIMEKKKKKVDGRCMTERVICHLMHMENMTAYWPD
jgi:hypothetical protein